MRGLCACWYWVMEHAEDTSTLPKTTAKLRNSVSHFSYRQIQPSWKPGKSQEWGTTIVSFINATNLNQPIQTFDSSVLQTGKWELSWVHSLPPTWPRPLAWKQEQEGGDPINFAPVWPHLGSAFGLFQWRIPCGGLSILVVFSPLVHSPNAFFLSGQIFQRLLISWIAMTFGNIHELQSLLPSDPKVLVASNVFLFTVILQPTSVLASTLILLHGYMSFVLHNTKHQQKLEKCTRESRVSVAGLQLLLAEQVVQPSKDSQPGSC